MRQLDLWPEWVEWLLWEGQSPRSLTRSQKGLFLRREPQKDDNFFADPDQLDLFHEATIGPPQYEGAPSLLPLPRRGR